MTASPAVRFAPATRARPVRATRLLVAAVAARRVWEASFAELPRLLAPGDVVVVNDAATLPASLFAETESGAPLEVRLLALPDAAGECDAVLFGAGDWRTPTEHRAPPPPLAPGDLVRLGRSPWIEMGGSAPQAPERLRLESLRCAPRFSIVQIAGRRARLRFTQGDEVVGALYAIGRPVQYAHIEAPLSLWDVQNVYASEPWAAEMPSAGRPLDFATLDALRKHGVSVVRLTHGAGLSSTGDERLDASLPWVERYRIPVETAEVVARAKREERRVLAVGTSVVRALESAEGTPGATHTTSLRIDAHHSLRVVTGLLTGMHDAATSHADLLAAFLPQDLLAEANRFAAARGFLGHELGDSCLILDA